MAVKKEDVVPTVCAAHPIMYDQLNHLRDNQMQIYDLLREQTDKSSETAVSIATLKTSTDAGFDRLETSQKSMGETVNQLAAGFARMEALLKRRRWTPGKIVAIATAVIGPTGIAAYLVLFK